jgi:hypothetical protein
MCGKLAASQSPRCVPTPPLSALINVWPFLLFQKPIVAVWPLCAEPVLFGRSP